MGVILDSNLSFENQVSHVTKTAFFHLRNIAKLRNMLSVSDAEKLVHAFMTSRLDYCNALLGGCPASSINKLQIVSMQTLQRPEMTKHLRRDDANPRRPQMMPTLRQHTKLKNEHSIPFQNVESLTIFKPHLKTNHFTSSLDLIFKKNKNLCSLSLNLSLSG